MWYAVMRRDDQDWGYGNHDLEEAKEMARKMGPDAYIAVINEGNDAVCVDEIDQDEF